MNGFMMMTALPPTMGHVYLINWAKQYCLISGIRTLYVMVCGQPHEPMTARDRLNALQAEVRKTQSGVNILFVNYDNAMPQEPKDDPDFWNKWISEIKLWCNPGKHPVVFASERYGFELAERLGGKFVPCNTYREVVPISASKIRENPFPNFVQIVPAAQQLFRKTITVFGPESTGKTTLAKKLANTLPGHYVPEWAREYLELQTSPETTESRMQEIVFGQMAAQETVHNFTGKPFIFQDTDLLSTIGFYELYKMDSLPAQRNFIAADHYLLLKDNVPFTPDPLRYGGDKRESDYKFWEGLLKEHKLPYTIIDGGTWTCRFTQARDVCEQVFLEHPIWSYRRQ